MDTDILGDILGLEEEFYSEGLRLGMADGARAGYTEGSVFAVEKAFDKLLQLGKLYGKALVWHQRLVNSSASLHRQAGSPKLVDQTKKQELVTGATAAAAAAAAATSSATIHKTKEEETGAEKEGRESPAFDINICESMPDLHEGSRLAKNIKTLLALVDPATIVLENTEDAVSEIEERLRGASVKAKLIQRALGEALDGSEMNISAGKLSNKQDMKTLGDGSGSIEDISSLHVRH